MIKLLEIVRGWMMRVLEFVLDDQFFLGIWLGVLMWMAVAGWFHD